jgi:hypothetical protein
LRPGLRDRSRDRQLRLHRGAWHEPPVRSLPLRNRARA